MARYIDADALIKRLGINKDCTECSYCTRKCYCSWNPDPGEICIAISEQPTVTINDHPNEIKVTNCHHLAEVNKKGDLISRADTIDALAEYVHNVDKVMGTGRLSWDDCKDSAISVLEGLPSAQPEIIHCGDCKWLQCNMRFDGTLPKGVDEFECRHWCGSCDPTDYCSYGERRA